MALCLCFLVQNNKSKHSSNKKDIKEKEGKQGKNKILILVIPNTFMGKGKRKASSGGIWM